MKIAVLIARILLGLIFVVFGLNGFHPFIPMKPPTGALAAQYSGALFLSHYLVPVFLLQLIGGVLLLSGWFIPLALVLLGPVIVNILLFHSLMAPEGIGPGLLVTLLWLIVFFGVRKAFAGIFAAKVEIG
jgi:putative oxidoreductase